MTDAELAKLECRVMTLLGRQLQHVIGNRILRNAGHPHSKNDVGNAKRIALWAQRLCKLAGGVIA